MTVFEKEPVEEADGRIISSVRNTISGIALAVELVKVTGELVFVGTMFLAGGVGVQLLTMLVSEAGSMMEAIK